MNTDFAQNTNILKTSKQCFYLAPTLWDTLGDVSLVWNKVPFEHSSIEKIPPKQGLYAFIVIPNAGGLPENAYLMYIGKAGHNSQNDLKKRFQQYLNEQRRMKRPHIFNLLNSWIGRTSFYYSVIPEDGPDLGDLETKFLDAFVPPFSKRGFSASLGAAIRGLN